MNHEKKLAECPFCPLQNDESDKDLTLAEFQKFHPELSPPQVTKLIFDHMDENPNDKTPLKSYHQRLTAFITSDMKQLDTSGKDGR